VVFWRVHALYLSADKSYRCLSLSVVSDDRKSAHTSHRLHMCFLQGTLRPCCEWLVCYVCRVAKMPFVFSHVEYCDMHFVYGFCDGNACAAVEEYQRRFPD